MTSAVLLFAGVCVWTYAVTYLAGRLIVWRRHRALDRAIDEALALTLPLGPEDYPDWGDAR